MNGIPVFFIPDVSPENEETMYAEFAQGCRAAVPAPGKRIYSITYRHDSDEWTATVGQRLRGTRLRVMRVRGKKIERTISLGDTATVLAIFEGYPFKVVTNHGIAPGIRSAWENPFYAGQPLSITYFSPKETTTD